jgi:phosphoheptose isomerase
MTSRASQIILNALDDAANALQSIGRLQKEIGQAADAIVESLCAGNKILACGNGGSAADTADFCTEFACRFTHDRRPYPAINLAAGGSLLTATANDYGFEETFARQVAAFGKAGDVLVAITTSGKSANIRRALEEGKARQLKTIALLGRDGGSCKNIADIDLIVPGDSTARIQEGHKFILHLLCEIVEPNLAK